MPDRYWGVAAGVCTRLRRYALRLHQGNEEEAMDLTQQTLAKTAECAGVGEKGDPWPLFRRVMLNAFVDRVRLRRREAGFDQEAFAGDPEDTLEVRFRQGQLAVALSRLSQEQLAIIRLVYAEGHSQREAAQLLGLTEEAVKQRLKRARSQLRRTCPSLLEGMNR